MITNKNINNLDVGVKYYVFLLIFLSNSFYVLLTYFISSIGLENKDLTAYIRLFILFVFIFYDRKNFLKYFFLLLYLLFYIIFTNNSFNYTARASFMMCFVIFLAACIFYSEKKVLFKIKKKQLNNSLLFIILFVSISILYTIFYGITELNDRLYLDSFVSAHSLGYILIAFSIYVYKYYKNISYVLLMYAFILGVRSVIIMGLIFVLYIIFNRKKYYQMLKYIVLLLILFLIVIEILPSLMTNHIDFYISMFRDLNKYGLQDKEFLSSVTAIRSTLLDNMYSHLGNWSISDYIFGKGPLSSIEFNEKTIGSAIWMHNDFLDTFYSYGLFGLTLYVLALIKLFNNYGAIFIVIIIILAALLNGFYTYYSEMYISLIFLYKNKFKFYD